MSEDTSMHQYTMLPEVKARWIAALRSGKFTQTEGCMKVERSKDKICYCALGVLLETEAPEELVLRNSKDSIANHELRLWGTAGDCATVKSSLRIRWGMTNDLRSCVIHLNDGEKRTFSDIADFLETQVDAPVSTVVKKPIHVRAFRFTGEESIPGDLEWVRFSLGEGMLWYSEADNNLYCKTLEGVVTCSPGNWVVMGVSGEVYPVEDSIFHQTFDIPLAHQDYVPPVTPFTPGPVLDSAPSTEEGI